MLQFNQTNTVTQLLMIVAVLFLILLVLVGLLLQVLSKADKCLIHYKLVIEITDTKLNKGQLLN
jgi:hypothetical protein